MDVDEKDIGIESDFLNKIISAVQKANEPIRVHIKWLMYGMVTALGMLVMTGVLL